MFLKLDDNLAISIIASSCVESCIFSKFGHRVNLAVFVWGISVYFVMSVPKMRVGNPKTRAVYFSKNWKICTFVV
jgi:hypothetical protein